MDIAHTLPQWQDIQRQAQPSPSGSWALVPTMGALHAGHMALVAHAKTLATHVAVSIFVNPTQFGPTEDFNQYPRTLAQDIALCEAHGVSAVFAPSVETMYPGLAEQGNACFDSLTMIHPPESLASLWCGASRPGHFAGVCTVVMKLFQLTQPNIAVFGEKDAQQVAVLQQMVNDLNVPVELAVVPTVREPDGLALSSRNRYLSVQARAVAQRFPQLLQQVNQQILAALSTSAAQPISLEPIFAEVWKAVFQTPYPTPKLNSATGKQQAGVTASTLEVEECPLQLDYLAVVDAQTFAPVTHLSAAQYTPGKYRIISALNVAQTRLIDNVRMD